MKQESCIYVFYIHTNPKLLVVYKNQIRLVRILCIYTTINLLELKYSIRNSSKHFNEHIEVKCT